MMPLDLFRFLHTWQILAGVALLLVVTIVVAAVHNDNKF
jgi:hypothetical protein